MKLLPTITVMCALGLIVLTGIAATERGNTPGFAHVAADTGRNLKVLHKNISEDSLYDIMEDYEHALGVGCGHCHVMDNGKGKEDYASDRLPAKERARDMMRMTDAINQQYFKAKTGLNPFAKAPLMITCNTCHRGKPVPDK